ncbi:YvrJ protein family protein [compost metagenome]
MDDSSFLKAIELIPNLGFPIVITTYLLLRFEKKIEKLSDAINELINVIKISSKEGK